LLSCALAGCAGGAGESASSASATASESPAGPTSLANSSSLILNGSSQYAAATSASTLSAYPFSFSAWIKTSSATAQTIVALNRSTVSNVYYRLGLNATGNVRVEIANTTARAGTSTATVNDGNWHHVVAVFVSNTSKLIYVDGAANGANTNNVSFNTLATTLTVGRNGGTAPGNYFNGRIDEVKVYSSGLGASEVAALYNSGHPIDATLDSGSYLSSATLLHWWRFGDVAGDDPETAIGDVKGASTLTPTGLTAGSIDAASAP